MVSDRVRIYQIFSRLKQESIANESKNWTANEKPVSFEAFDKFIRKVMKEIRKTTDIAEEDAIRHLRAITINEKRAMRNEKIEPEMTKTPKNEETHSLTPEDKARLDKIIASIDRTDPYSIIHGLARGAQKGLIPRSEKEVIKRSIQLYQGSQEMDYSDWSRVLLTAAEMNPISHLYQTRRARGSL